MTRLAVWWDRAWFAPTQPLALAVFRIAFGLLWLDILVSSFPNWMRFYGADGIVPFAWLGETYFARPSLLAVSSGEGYSWAFYWSALAAGVAFTIGYRTRVATVVLFLAVISMINRTPSITHGEDLVSRQLLFFACFASLGDAWSVDAWLRRRSGLPDPRPGSIWPLRLMQISTTFVYLFSTPAKPADDVAWIDGSAIYYVMASYNWGRFPALAPLFYSGPLSALMSWGTLVIEGSFPFLVWSRRTRPYTLAALAGLHTGISLLTNNVFNFNLVMLTSLLLFVPDPMLKRTVSAAWRAASVLRPAHRNRGAAHDPSRRLS